MALQSKCFPYEKSIIINALYDTIDVLGLRLISVNSASGTLIVTDAERTGELRIELGVGASAKQTLVEVYCDGSIADAWHTVILDELAGMVKRCVTARRDPS